MVFQDELAEESATKLKEDSPAQESIMSNTFDPYHTWLGIAPAEQPPNHYRLLGIALFEESRDVISNAADRQMAHIRTFQGGKHAAESQKLLNELSKRIIGGEIDHEKPVTVKANGDELTFEQ